jgi:hypothetical protein
MMKQKSFEKALVATARVACCSILFGTISCKPKTTPNEATPPLNDNTNVNTDDTDTKVEEVAQYPAGFDECVSEFETVFEQLPLNLTDKVMDCCNQYIEYLEENNTIAEYKVDCCEVTNFTSTACTPWGPPTPPKMRSLVS